MPLGGQWFRTATTSLGGSKITALPRGNTSDTFLNGPLTKVSMPMRKATALAMEMVSWRRCSLGTGLGYGCEPSIGDGSVAPERRLSRLCMNSVDATTHLLYTIQDPFKFDMTSSRTLIMAYTPCSQVPSSATISISSFKLASKFHIAINDCLASHRRSRQASSK